MQAINAYRLPTGEMVFTAPAQGWADWPWRLLNSEFFGFLTAFVVTLSALAIAGG